MTRQGGAWAKAGISYEGHWTVRHLLHLIDQRAEKMRIEDPGPQGEGVEFWLETAAHQREYHQAKRQHGERGSWSIASLRRADILKVIDEKLSDPDVAYVFVSEHAAFPLDRLCEEAKLAPDAKTFEAQCNSVEKLRASLGSLREDVWKQSAADAYDRLGRIIVHKIDESLLREWNEDRVRTLLEGGNTKLIADTLFRYSFDAANAPEPIGASDVWACLAEGGVSARDWGAQDTASALQDTVDASQLRTSGIAGLHLERAEQRLLSDALSRPDGPRQVLVIGSGGAGKTSIINAAVSDWVDSGRPACVLPLDAIQEDRPLTPDQLGARYSLDGTPTAALAGVSDDGPSLLVIDQLDAASIAGGRAPQLFESVKKILAQAGAHPGLKIVLAGRPYEIENDRRIRALRDDEAVYEIAVGKLVIADIEKGLTSVGIEISQLDADQVELLTDPLNLKLLAESADAEVPMNFRTKEDLMERWTNEERRRYGE